MVPNVDSHVVLTLSLVEKQRTVFARQKLAIHISCIMALSKLKGAGEATAVRGM